MLLVGYQAYSRRTPATVAKVHFIGFFFGNDNHLVTIHLYHTAGFVGKYKVRPTIPANILLLVFARGHPSSPCRGIRPKEASKISLERLSDAG